MAEGIEDTSESAKQMNTLMEEVFKGAATPEEKSKVIQQIVDINPTSAVAGKIRSISRPWMSTIFEGNPVGQALLKKLETLPSLWDLVTTPASEAADATFAGRLLNKITKPGNKLDRIEVPTLELNPWDIIDPVREGWMNPLAPMAKRYAQTKQMRGTGAHELFHALDLYPENLGGRGYSVEELKKLDPHIEDLVKRVEPRLSPLSKASLADYPNYQYNKKHFPRLYQSEVLAHGISDAIRSPKVDADTLLGLILPSVGVTRP